MEETEIRNEIIQVLRGVNKNLASRANAKDNLILYGADGGLDSLDLVTFLLALEEKIYALTNKKLMFISDSSFMSKSSPFKDLDSLEKYILRNLSTLKSI